jgi:ABC-type oligopeptide transport system ATPase subunit
MTSVLSVKGLTVDFQLPGAVLHAVRGVDLEVAPGEVLALVGESGSGKSVTAAAILGLLPHTARITGGSVRFGDTELVGLPDAQLNAFRGAGIGMIFQNPVTSLDPPSPSAPSSATPPGCTCGCRAPRPGRSRTAGWSGWASASPSACCGPTRTSCPGGCASAS